MTFGNSLSRDRHNSFGGATDMLNEKMGRLSAKRPAPLHNGKTNCRSKGERPVRVVMKDKNTDTREYDPVVVPKPRTAPSANAIHSLLRAQSARRPLYYFAAKSRF